MRVARVLEKRIERKATTQRGRDIKLRDFKVSQRAIFGETPDSNR